MLNICLLGDSSVGKTTSLQTYKNNVYTPSEVATIGVAKFIMKKDDITINVSKLFYFIFKSLLIQLVKRNMVVFLINI